MTDLRDAYELLGLRPGAGPEEVAAAYRNKAKALHPDRTGEDADAGRMAAVNVAHEVLTAALLTGIGSDASDAAPAAARPSGPAATRRRPGDWLPAEVRHTLGAELLAELSDGERVHAVVPASTWASPRTVLVVTDRRLVWLLDDIVAGRVRSLRYAQVAEVRASVRGRRRPRSSLRVRPRHGRPATFAELPVDLAPGLARRIEAAMAAAS